MSQDGYLRVPDGVRLNGFVLVLTALALVCCCFVGGVSAAEHTEHGEGWTELPTTSSTLSSGNYYLANNVSLTNPLQIANGDTVNLCLNGFVLTVADGAEAPSHGGVISVNPGATLNIYDCPNEKTYRFSDPGNGGAWILDEYGDKTVTGGVITGGTALQGGGISVTGGASLNLFGGNIVGNTATLDPNSYHADGGGGGVIVGVDSSFNMSGGTIQGNNATANGGAVFVAGGFTEGHTGKFTMSGGTITENNANYGGGVYVCGYSDIFNSEYTNGGTVTVSGSANITGNNATTGNNILLPALPDTARIIIGGTLEETVGISRILVEPGTLITDDDLTLEKLIALGEGQTSYPDSKINPANNAELIVGNIGSTDPVPTETPDTPVEYTDKTEHHNDHNSRCCDAVNEWLNWTENNSPANPGDYVLGVDVVLGGDWKVSGNTHLCLNGHALDLNGHHINVTSGTLTIHDCNSIGKTYTFHNNSTTVDHLWVLNVTDAAAGSETVTINGGVIHNGTSGYHGGAVSVEPGAALVIEGGNIVGNYCYMVSNTYNSGGALYVNSGSITINGGIIAGNVAVDAGNGGAIFAVNSTVKISGGTIRDNHAHGSGTGGSGGGIVLYGYGTDQKITFNMTGGNITNNHAHAVAHRGTTEPNIPDSTLDIYGSGNGGGIFVLSSQDCKAEIEISGGNITHNIAEGKRQMDSDINENRDGLGGGIYLYATGGDANVNSFFISGDAKVSHNSADDGGGIYATEGAINLDGGEISYNTANRGGGFFGYGLGTYTMTAGKISHNTVEDNMDDELDGGGGVYLSGAVFHMHGGEISDNHVIGWYGNGGGVLLDNGTLHLASGKIANNTAYGGGGNGGGVFIYAGDKADCSFVMEGEAVITNNTATTTFQATGYIGSDRTNIQTPGHGGGLYVFGHKNATLEVNLTKGIISNNRVSAVNESVPVFGGGIYLNSQNTTGHSSAFTMKDGVKITGNTATNGGGLDITGSSVAISGGEISNNTASRGAGIHLREATSFTLSGGKITNNTIESSTAVSDELGGGGIYVSSAAELKLTGGEISNNNASLLDSRGGGIYLYINSQLTINNADVLIANNSADDGGGVFLNNQSRFEFSAGTIENNTAYAPLTEFSGGGGVALSSDCLFNLTGTAEIRGNSAFDGGGVFVSRDSTFNMTGGNITENTVLNKGGGVFIWNNSALELSGGNITRNSVGEDTEGDENHGGGVYLVADSRMNVSKLAHVTGNLKGTNASNVYLPMGSMIRIVEPLVSGAMINVTTQEEPIYDSPVNVTTVNDASYMQYFGADKSYLRVNQTTSYQVILEETRTPSSVFNHQHTDPDPGHEVGNHWHEFNSSTQFPLIARTYALSENVTLSESLIIEPVGKAKSAADAELPAGVPAGIHLCLNGYVLNLTEGVTDSVITVESGATLYLYNCNATSYTISYTENGEQKTVEVTGGSVTGGKTEYGGGIEVHAGGTLVMYGGNIVGNSATEKGGGIYLADASVEDTGGSANLTMLGGNITHNHAQTGGGVYVGSEGVFILDNGTISQNTVSASGGGVALGGADDAIADVTLSGKATIAGNKAGAASNNLYLESSQTVTIGEKGLTDGANIAVKPFANDQKVVDVTGENSKDYSTYFHSDVAAYSVQNDGAGNVVQLVQTGATFTVTWMSEGIVLETDENVAYGTQPSYDETEPTKFGSYEFAGWTTTEGATEGTPESNLPKVTNDVTYYAVFTPLDVDYTITIPSTVTLNPDMSQTSEYVTISELNFNDASGKALVLYVKSANGWSVVEQDTAVSVGYQMSVGDTTVQTTAGDKGLIMIFEKSEEISATTETTQLSFKLTETPRYSGTYQDTLTFMVDIESTSSAAAG